jgi:hypothetical protein
VGIAGGMVSALKTDQIVSSVRTREPMPVQGAFNA